MPCENTGVTCVGALEVNSEMKRPDSNYGGAEVDIFGPGAVWVGPDLDNQAIHGFTATSAAAPFVAGVGAPTFAAKPGLNANDVERILIETANRSSDGNVRRYVNAYDAVDSSARAARPREITIAVQAAQLFSSCRVQFHFSQQRSATRTTGLRRSLGQATSTSHWE